MQIAERTVAAFHYTLTNAAGEVLDSSRDREPLVYLHGGHNIVPGLEAQMAGHVAGDRFSADVAAADGYGDYIAELVQVVPRAAFAGVDDLEVGMQFQAQTAHGTIPVVITGEVSHRRRQPPARRRSPPLDIEIVEVREASVESCTATHGEGGIIT